LKSNPFICSRPVTSDEFVDRIDPLQTLFSYLNTRQSTTVVGIPRIGQTSLLYKLKSVETREKYLGETSTLFEFKYIDLSTLEPDCAVSAFWSEALEPLESVEDYLPPNIRNRLEIAQKDEYADRALKKLFRALSETKYCLVLLLDRFENLLKLPDLWSHHFLAVLRQLAGPDYYPTLAVIAASRLSLTEMSNSLKILWSSDSDQYQRGSQPFSYMQQLILGTFEEYSVLELLDRAKDRFDDADRRFIRQLAGRHPYLLQAAAETLFDQKQSPKRLLEAESRVYSNMQPHFQEVWEFLGEDNRSAALILSLEELGEQADGIKLAREEAKRATNLSRNLAELKALGLAEQVGGTTELRKTEHPFTWQGEQWMLASQGFLTWMHNAVLPEWLATRQCSQQPALLPTAASIPPSKATLTWLHVSDFHFDTDKPWHSQRVLARLIEDIEARSTGIAPEVSKIDMIFITGDLAISAKPEQYQRAGEFLDKLQRATGVRKDRMFVVPGNHDVNRASLEPLASRDLLKDSHFVRDIYYNKGSRISFLKRFDTYREFIAKKYRHLALDPDCFLYVRKRTICDRIISSAWTCSGDEEYGKLVLGAPQVEQAIAHPNHKKADVKLILLHHPPAWFKEFDQSDCAPHLYRGCHFLLHGHLHRTGIQELSAPRQKAMILGAGAGYLEEDRAKGRSLSYNIVHLNFDSRQGVVYLREYTDRDGGHWTSDTRTYGDIPGKFEFDLPVDL
jgi:predicted MPP superfamily phosphohydrolase